jgi:hypothetical protein
MGRGAFNLAEVDNAVDEWDRLGTPELVRTRRGAALGGDWDWEAGPGAVWGRPEDFNRFGGGRTASS